MSAVKRKREEADSYPAKMDWSRSAIRSIATGIESPESSSNKPSYLLSDGSLLVISDDRLVFYADVLNRGLAELQQHDYSGLDEADSFSTELSIPSHARRRFFVRDSGRSRRNGELYPEVVCVSPGGSLQFWQPRKNGQHVTVCFTMLLADIERDEYIRDVLFEGMYCSVYCPFRCAVVTLGRRLCRRRKGLSAVEPEQHLPGSPQRPPRSAGLPLSAIGELDCWTVEDWRALARRGE